MPRTFSLEPSKLPLVDAEAYSIPGLFSQEEADELFASLLNNIVWKQETATMFGKAIPMPRLTAWYGDPGTVYSYSGITHTPLPWNDTIVNIKARIEALSDTIFNSVLLNRYRSGSDSVSWHSDDEAALGKNPVIGSVSFGHNRAFQLKHKRDPNCKLAIELTHGSFLLMAGPMQHHWLHQVPKTKKPVGERINLTFRTIHK